MHKLITAYGKHKKVGFKTTAKSLTKQSFTEECDINNIMKKYQKTGALDHLNKHEASYGFATSLSFQEALDTVEKGQTMFDELPSSIRTKFDNDPGIFLDFVQDENNMAEMVELGLATNKIKTNESDPSTLAKPPEGQKESKKPDQQKTSESEKKE